ncbi:Redoxin [Gaiella occulta]|uniref:Redoxin n=1 Tax=Gaiella occulta TaxID=1002870 RepID=A0A7M2Z2L7_9ACTN|nr:TlpA disulfide reductase family protein [Gaiella occulta]RDI76244.1 Redoxin [Gaiella occulta]
MSGLDPAPIAGASPPAAAEETRSRRRIRPTHVAQAAAISLVAALLALLVWKLVAGSAGAGFVKAIERGERPSAPAFDLPVIWNRTELWPTAVRGAGDDGRLSLAELRGHPVVLNFWASWCIPCKEEAPAFDAAARAHRGKIAFLGLDVQDLVPDARRFLDTLDVPYASVRDGTPNSYSAYGLTGVPETYFIDARGRVVAHAVGALSRRELEASITALLAAPAS